MALLSWSVVALWQALEGEKSRASISKDGGESAVPGLQKKKLAEKEKRKCTRRVS